MLSRFGERSFGFIFVRVVVLGVCWGEGVFYGCYKVYVRGMFGFLIVIGSFVSVGRVGF